MGPGAAPAVPALTARVADADFWVRVLACDALSGVGAKAVAAVDALIVAAHAEDRFLRRRAILALGKIGPPAKAAWPVLLEIEKGDSQEDVVQAARTALHQIDLDAMAQDGLDQAPPEIRELVGKLSGSDPFEAVAAAKALATQGADAHWAVASLAQALRNKNKWVREAAATALGKLGSNSRPVLPALQQAAEDADSDVQQAAEKAVEAIGE
jgi:HEAT repeat protein